jgi:hypothetical protein
MNERIKELMAEADRKCSETRGIYDEILAELIVRECIELAMNEKSRYASLYNKESDANKYLTMLHCATSMDNYGLLLKEHFGVEP